MWPVLQALKKLAGTARICELDARIAADLGLEERSLSLSLGKTGRRGFRTSVDGRGPIYIGAI